MYLLREHSLMRARFLIWCILTFLTNLICRCLHDLVHTQIQIDMIFVNCQSLSMVNARDWFVISDIWATLGCGQMCFRTLIIVHFGVSVFADVNCLGLDDHVLLPELVWLHTVCYFNWTWSPLRWRCAFGPTYLMRATFVDSRRLVRLSGLAWAFGGVVVFPPFLYSVSRFLTGLGSMANFLTTFIVSTSRITSRLLFPWSGKVRALIVTHSLARCPREAMLLRPGGRLRFRHWCSHLILIKSDV